jgi:hypothetical protein
LTSDANGDATKEHTPPDFGSPDQIRGLEEKPGQQWLFHLSNELLLLLNGIRPLLGRTVPIENRNA